MTNKRFIVETVMITDCCTDESRIAKVITDTNELYSYDDLYELCDDLNKLAEENEQLRQQVQNAKEIAVKNDMQYQICRKEKEDFQDMCEQLRQRNRKLYKCALYGKTIGDEI